MTEDGEWRTVVEGSGASRGVDKSRCRDDDCQFSSSDFRPPTSVPRRGTLRAAVAVIVGALLGRTRLDEAAARRNACGMRCGGSRRLCKAQCRTAPIPKQCKKTCVTLRDQCFERCQFKSLNRSQARDEWSSIGHRRREG
jgi:hypothetical protein